MENTELDMYWNNKLAVAFNVQSPETYAASSIELQRITYLYAPP